MDQNQLTEQDQAEQQSTKSFQEGIELTKEKRAHM